ncbi:MAG: STAS domain-containing protein [Bacteroidales bacterium]|nr:STAS domain-containing protein [Bacteroidales bacterium]
MNISFETKSNFTVIHLTGRIDVTNSNDLETELIRLFEDDRYNLLINCAELNYISSSGLRVFLLAQKKVMAAQGDLIICSLQPMIREIFDISGLSTIFKICKSEEEALQKI